MAATAAPLGFWLLGHPGAEFRIAEISQPLDAMLQGDLRPVAENGLKLLGFFGWRGDPLVRQNITPEGVRKLAAAAEACWEGIVQKDIRKFGAGLTGTHEAWAEILPLTTNRRIEDEMARHKCHGRITSGCGGGYLVMASEDDIPGGFRVKVRRALG